MRLAIIFLALVGVGICSRAQTVTRNLLQSAPAIEPHEKVHWTDLDGDAEVPLRVTEAFEKGGEHTQPARHGAEYRLDRGNRVQALVWDEQVVQPDGRASISERDARVHEHADREDPLGIHVLAREVPSEQLVQRGSRLHPAVELAVKRVRSQPAASAATAARSVNTWMRMAAIGAERTTPLRAHEGRLTPRLLIDVWTSGD